MMTSEEIMNIEPDAREAYYELLAQLLIVDFQVTEEEQKLLSDVGQVLGLSAEEQTALLKRVNIDGDVSALMERLSSADRGVIMSALRNAAMADGQVQARERALLRKVAELFGDDA